MIVLGIDIGVTGALAALDSRGSCQIRDLPVQEYQTASMVKRRLCPVGLMRLVREFVPAGEVALALFEDVHSMPGDSGPSGFSLGESRGVVRAVLELARLDAHAIQPQAWKRHYGIVKDKSGGQARATACNLYPIAAGMLGRVKDHNRADALLIAHYGRGKFA